MRPVNRRHSPTRLSRFKDVLNQLVCLDPIVIGSDSNKFIAYDLILCILVIMKGFKSFKLGLGSSILTLVVRFVARFPSPFQ